ncbi:F-box protein CPR1-like [Papaver somniferum]|uniref:F-box protein CPR1-like n=1 Tax=Papaver somniferum TaxID=3469 RepID=UPI000E6F7F1E|nr:F-box protein CPR1-like [Papaver somniferum]
MEDPKISVLVSCIAELTSGARCREGENGEYLPFDSGIRMGIKWGIEVFGCCYGFVLLRDVNKFNKCVLMLWNPTTDECKRIPNPPAGTKGEDRNYEEYGFGYSEGIEDFKVVHLTEALQEGLCEVQVYTLKSNSWRRADNVEIYDIYWHQMSDEVRRPTGGAAHWLAHVESSIEGHCIARFEFESEEFDATSLPVSTDLPPTLCALGGSVCFFIRDLFDVITIWELKNNVVEKSWNKLFAIDLTKTFGSVYGFIPLKSLRNGKIVVGLQLNKAELHIVLYDPKHGTVETLKVHESMVPTDYIFVYEEHLHSLGTGTHLAQLKGKTRMLVKKNKI